MPVDPLYHGSLTSIHRAAYVQDADPGAVGPLKWWVETSGGGSTVVAIWIRNSANTSWISVPLSGTGGNVATDALWDAKGDLAVGLANNSADNLAVGTNGQVLTADSAMTLGVKWATPTTGVTDHGALTGLLDDDHTQYLLRSIVDAKGDIVTATANDTVARLPVGSDGQVLTAASGQSTGLQWATPSSGGHTIQDEGTPLTARANLNFTGGGVTATDNSGSSRTDVTIPTAIYPTLVDAKGDLLVGTANDTIARQAVGTNNQALLADSAQTNGVVWGDVVRPALVDAKGDLLAGTANDTITRLAVGTDNQALLAASGQSTGLQWGDVIRPAIYNAKGDLLSATANDTPAILSVGSDGQFLKADSAETTGLKWVTLAGQGAYSALIGDGSSTQITVTHNLGTKDIVPSFRDASTDEIYIPGPKPIALTTNTARFDFATAPATNSIRVTILAAGAGGSGTTVATDTLWDAKGDLAVGTGADTASRLAVGTNGHVLTADSTTGTGLKWAAASGGAPDSADYWVETANGSLSAEVVVGTTGITKAAFASRQAAAKAGRIFLPTDSFYVQRDNGSGWDTWGPVYPMTPPDDSQFSWVNQGGASVATGGGGVYLFAPAGAGANHRIRKKAAPSTPYTITAALQFLNAGQNNNGGGLVLRQSSDGKLITIIFQIEGGAYVWYVCKWTNVTTFLATYVGAIGHPHTPPMWYRISDNGTTRTYQFSHDKQNWYTLTTNGHTDFMTADEVGFFANSQNATWGAGVTLLSWEQT